MIISNSDDIIENKILKWKINILKITIDTYNNNNRTEKQKFESLYRQFFFIMLKICNNYIIIF